MALLSQIDKVLDETDWYMAKIKADKANSALENLGCGILDFVSCSI
jgi:hypothetical protein